MQGLVSDLATDPQLGRLFRERVVAFRVSEMRRVVERAAERGELRPGVDVDLVHELLFGPVYKTDDGTAAVTESTGTPASPPAIPGSGTTAPSPSALVSAGSDWLKLLARNVGEPITS